MLRDFTWTEKYEEAMSDEQPQSANHFVSKAASTFQWVNNIKEKENTSII